MRLTDCINKSINLNNPEKLNIAELASKSKNKVNSVLTEDSILKSLKDWIIENKAEIESTWGIIEDNGIWYFFNLASLKRFKKIKNMTFNSFIGRELCKKFNLGSSEGYLRSINHIKSLFTLLGLKVANAEQEMIFKDKYLPNFYELNNLSIWRNELLNNSAELSKVANIYMISGVWYFSSCKGLNLWPKIGGRSMRLFPNLGFNRYNELGDQIGMLSNIEQVKMMFKKIGFTVATDEQEESNKNIIYLNNFILNEAKGFVDFINSNKEEIKNKLNIFEAEGKWYFYDIVGYRKWGMVNGVYMKYFPKTEFNKLNGIGLNSGVISGGKSLKKIFELIGLNVANEEEEKQMKINNIENCYNSEVISQLKNTISNGSEELYKITGIKEAGGICDFGKCLPIEKFPKQLFLMPISHFPNTEFNKFYNIGSKFGQIRSIADIRRVFEVLGFKIITKKLSKKINKLCLPSKKESQNNKILYGNIINHSGDNLKIFDLKCYKSPLFLYVDFGQGLVKIKSDNIKQEVISLLEADIKSGNIEKVKYVKFSIMSAMKLFFSLDLGENSIKNHIIADNKVIFPDVNFLTSVGNIKISLIVGKDTSNVFETCDKNMTSIN